MVQSTGLPLFHVSGLGGFGDGGVGDGRHAAGADSGIGAGDRTAAAGLRAGPGGVREHQPLGDADRRCIQLAVRSIGGSVRGSGGDDGAAVGVGPDGAGDGGGWEFDRAGGDDYVDAGLGAVGFVGREFGASGKVVCAADQPGDGGVRVARRDGVHRGVSQRGAGDFEVWVAGGVERVGWTLVAVLAPLAWWVVREAPATAEVPGPTGGMAFGRALRTGAFWVFGLSSAMFGLVYSGIALFNQSILERKGFDATTYQTVLVVSTLLGLVANFGGGWVATRWPIQRLMGVGMAVLAGSLVALPLVGTFGEVMGYGVAMGVAGGVVTVVFFSVWSQVFGRAELGRIQGAAQMMTVVASAIGPVLLAEALARTGSYDLVFWILAGLTAALGVACWKVRLPI